MPTPWVWSPLLAGNMIVLACGPKHPPAPVAPPAAAPTVSPMIAVKGTATYRERMAMPAGAVFEAILEDVSRVGAPAEVIGSTRIERPGNVPIAFEIGYEPSRIVVSHRYTVRGRILVEGRLFFATDQYYPILTGGAGNQVELLLRRVGASTAAPLENTYWKLTWVGSSPIAAIAGAREMHLMLDSGTRRVSGFSGCNTFSGAYEVRGDQLTLTQMAGTLMACVGPGAETEKAVLEALTKVSRWKITGQQLDLLDDSGGMFARFEARA